MEEKSGEGKIVCVTGGSGYIASWLVKLLLLHGYTVNATVRDSNDPRKIEHLLALEGAKERLHLFRAELTEEGSFDDAISGCDGVFHTASPCFFVSEDPQTELVDPAVKGTINVLTSCAKFPSVKRVVLTSSLAAIGRTDKPKTRNTVIDESWFSDSEFCRKEKRWYALSKTLAEETAWSYAKENGLDLVSINPGYVIGPLLQPKLNESSSIYLDMIKAKTYSNDVYEVVDIKDVANAHILAFETISANGRYCLVESIISVSEILNILLELYPTLQLPTKLENDNPRGIKCHISKEKAKNLGISFIPFKTSLKEMIESLKEKKLNFFLKRLTSVSKVSRGYAHFIM